MLPCKNLSVICNVCCIELLQHCVRSKIFMHVYTAYYGSNKPSICKTSYIFFNSIKTPCFPNDSRGIVVWYFIMFN